MFFNKKKKIEQDKSEIAKKYQFRISNPYGYFPEDVDKVVQQLASDLSEYTKENKRLSEELNKAQDEVREANVRITELTFQIDELNNTLSNLQIPDFSTEVGFEMLGGMGAITGNYSDYESLQDLKTNELKQKNNKLKLNLDDLEEN